MSHLDRPDHRYMVSARTEIGETWWDTSTGAIAGVVVGVVYLGLMYGFDDFEDNMGVGYLIVFGICGLGGFFFGRKKRDDHSQKILNRARELQQEFNSRCGRKLDSAEDM